MRSWPFEVRRLSGEIETGEDDETVDGVGEAVDGLRLNGETAGREPRHALHGDE
jgi:hypothetical protein